LEIFRMRNSKNILFVAGGVAAGVAAMYLLDSEAGQRRREAIADAANYAAHHAGDAIHSVGERIGEHAAQAAGAMAAAAPTATGIRRLIGAYHDRAHHLADRFDQFRHAVEPQAARAARAVQAGQAMLVPVMSHARSALGGVAWGGRKVAKGSLIIVPLTVGGVACVAAGAGAMYLLDPDSGRRRRKNIREGVAGGVCKVGRFARASGQNLRHHAEGMAREVGLISRPRVSNGAHPAAPTT
jgi:gas vesicle protein